MHTMPKCKHKMSFRFVENGRSDLLECAFNGTDLVPIELTK